MSLSLVQLFGTPSLPSFSIARISQAEYWSRLPFPSLGDLPELGIEPQAPTLQADFFLLSEPPGKHCPTPPMQNKKFKVGEKKQNSVCTFQRVHHWGIQMHPYCWLWVT